MIKAVRLNNLRRQEPNMAEYRLIGFKTVETNSFRVSNLMGIERASELAENRRD